MVKKIDDQFWCIFDKSKFDFIFTPQGQGILTIINTQLLPNQTTVSLQNISNGFTLAHSVNLNFENGKNISLVNLYQPPSSDAIHDLVFQEILNCDLLAGDINVYLQRNKFKRDRQIQDLIQTHDFVNLGNFNTFPSSSSNEIGPDLVLQSPFSDVLVDSVRAGTLISDHSSIDLEILNLEVRSVGRSNFKNIKIFDFARISSTFMISEYEKFCKRKDLLLEDFYDLWEGWLVYCAKTIRVPSNSAKSGRYEGAFLAASSNPKDYEERLGDWLIDSNNISNLGSTFKLINFLSDTNGENNSEKAKFNLKTTVSRVSKEQSWENYTSSKR